MAKRFRSDLVADELSIAVYPRAEIVWIGTRDQILAEGVLASNVEWPQAGGLKTWVDADGWDWYLRVSKSNSQGYLRRTRAQDRCSGFMPAQLYAKEQELRHIHWMATPEGQLQSQRMWRAQRDRPFQGFMKALLRAPRVSTS